MNSKTQTFFAAIFILGFVAFIGNYYNKFLSISHLDPLELADMWKTTNGKKNMVNQFNEPEQEIQNGEESEREDKKKWKEIKFYSELEIPTYPKGVENMPKKLTFIYNSRTKSKPMDMDSLPYCECSRDPKDKAPADAILFHQLGYDLDKLTRDSPNQIFIGVHKESPVNHRIIRKMKVDTNWTMTYRRDSEIYSGYSSPISRVPFNCNQSFARQFPKFKEYRKNRTKSVAWAVSHCSTGNHRKEYAQELAKHIDVDIYGPCAFSNLSCSKAEDKCWDMLARKYKFWLAFENSHCKDYITEKLFRSLEYGFVPIVYGCLSKEDYEYFLPPHSYIDTRNFQSPEKFAQYLHFLNENPEEYDKYHEWRSFYGHLKNTSWPYLICAKLWNIDKYANSYTNKELYQWWSEDKCIYDYPYKPEQSI